VKENNQLHQQLIKKTDGANTLPAGKVSRLFNLLHVLA